MKTATAPLPPLRSVGSGLVAWSAYCYLHYSFTQPNRLRLTGLCFIRFHGVRHPANRQRSRGISVRLANERKVSSPRIVRHYLLFFTEGAVQWIASLPEIEDPAVAALAGGADPGLAERILGFLEGEHRRPPSFCMERACGSVRVCNRGSAIWILITARSSCGGQGLHDRPDVT